MTPVTIVDCSAEYERGYRQGRYDLLLERAANDLWASRDICAHFGVSRTTLQRWRTHPRFPKPWRHVSCGNLPVWTAAAVKRWHAQRDA